ncbi:hypothetical protein ABKN59_006796 [Abortiporus biennis]
MFAKFAKLTAIVMVLPAALTIAAPSKRDGVCGDGVGDFEKSFTLATFFKDQPNSPVGTPLVLSPHGHIPDTVQPGGIDFFVLTSYASYAHFDFNVYIMHDGWVDAYGSDGRIALSTNITPGIEAQFYTTPGPQTIAPNVYCGLPGTSKYGADNANHARFAVGTDADNFALCPDGNVTTVFYQPAAAVSQAGCVPVDILLIPTSD